MIAQAREFVYNLGSDSMSEKRLKIRYNWAFQRQSI
jgi:hypothetical protein